jgi:mycothiol synthase
MERPRGLAVPEPVWPAGVTVRTLDGSDAMLADWNDAYNQSFAEHYRYIPSPLEHVRELAAAPGFHPDGIVLAYRDAQVVGFCRTEQHGTRGEISTLGTSPAARGIGLGRALLRWGVRWLEANSPGAITLLVDGQNDGALSLYKSEGFAVTRTRGLWKRLEPRV